MVRIKFILLVILGTVASLGYLFVLCKSIGVSLYCYGKDCVIADYLADFATASSILLTANVGAVLGISISKPGSKFRLVKIWNPLRTLIQPSFASVQTLACCIYLTGLIACLFVYGIKDFNDQNVVPVIVQQAKSLSAILVAVLSVLLANPTAPVAIRTHKVK